MQPWFALCTVIVFLFPLSSSVQAQTPPSVVIEASNSIQSDGREQKELFVRLSSDGKVEWETTEWQKPNELHSSRIAPELVSAITNRLVAVDPEAIQAKMGPYNRYVDTSSELFIRINTLKWNRQFSVLNPWPHWPVKPLPKELKAVICEVVRLRAKVTREPVEPLCEEGPATGDAKKSQR
jgi:hypothetical protein